MSLSDLIKSDSAAFVSLSDFGETVVYTPRGGGTPVTINAIIDRSPRRRTDQTGKVFQPTTTIVVPNSATTGILSSDPKMIGGSLTYASRPGQTPITQTIRDNNPNVQDDGMLEFTF